MAADPSLMAQPAGELVPAERARLVDADGNTLTPDALTVGQSYVFHYPYVTTPCFLIDLGLPAEPGAELETSDGRPYRWSGGVGPGRSIVAFSAICAHRMSYPTRKVSFIDYRHKPMNIAVRKAASTTRATGRGCSRGLHRSRWRPCASSTTTTIGPCSRPASTAAICSSGFLPNSVSRLRSRTSGMTSGARRGM